LAFTERELLALMRRQADEIFASVGAEFPPSLRVQRLLREGDPAGEIIASAGEWNADLIVMGAHGRGRLATFLLGSTAEAVIRGAHCPVLTVAHDPRVNAPPPPDTGSIGVPAIAL
jgi:nucleotide-binding universal stress UspA family protein